MQLVLSWPVRVLVVLLLIGSIFVDGAGYWYRIVNHYPLTGQVSDLPPHFGDYQIYIHRGLDISGGTHLELQLTDIPPGRSKSDVQRDAITVLEKRVNALGVSEPQIYAEGSDRIVVDLAGVTSARAQEVIGRRAQLVWTKWVPCAKDEKCPAGRETTDGYKPQLTDLTGANVTSANASLDANGVNWVVNITLNQQGADTFGKLTTEAVNSCPGATDCPTRHTAVWLDLTQDDIATMWNDPAGVAKLTAPPDQGGKLLTNPTDKEPILGGQFFIEGQFSRETATDLATQINSGALPASIKVLSSSDVGASLGAQSIKASLAAGALGLALVIIFMIAFYRVPGFLASLALVFYAGLLLALFKVIPVTLTLAGMAGAILSVGMAVDANVLIFERFKEEMRAGRTIAAAVDAAVRRAWPAIRDSNWSTGITSAILAFLGTGPVRGFAVTLLLGVVVSMISSIIVTHNLLAIVLNFGALRRPGLMGVVRGRAV
jgi:preprotein translocase subunit SecD